MIHFVLSGGSNYVQFFSDQQPVTIAANQTALSSDRTPLLTDHDFTTCISRSSTNSYMWAKVQPSEFFVRRKTVSVQLAGKGITCSPLGGISIGLQPSCDDGSDCINTQPCVTRQAPQREGLHVCDYHCVTTTDWQFVVAYLSHLAADPGGYTPELCEIWFVNWMLMTIITHTFPQSLGCNRLTSSSRIEELRRSVFCFTWVNCVFALTCVVKSFIEGTMYPDGW